MSCAPSAATVPLLGIPTNHFGITTKCCQGDPPHPRLLPGAEKEFIKIDALSRLMIELTPQPTTDLASPSATAEPKGISGYAHKGWGEVAGAEKEFVEKYMCSRPLIALQRQTTTVTITLSANGGEGWGEVEQAGVRWTPSYAKMPSFA
jgi:hypothetical protein